MNKMNPFAPLSSRTPARGLASTLALAIAACAAFAPAARAVSMRDDVPNVNSSGTDNPYVALGASAALNAVGMLQGPTGSASTATGMLAATTTPGLFKYLTAASNVDANADGVIDAAAYDIYFGAATSADGSTSTAHVTVSRFSVSVSPQWVNGSGSIAKASPQYNLAVITFTLGMVVNGSVSGITPFGFSTASPLGKTGTLVGYGNFGTGNAFANNAANGVRRAGNNSIDYVATGSGNTGLTVQTDFDSPRDSSLSTLGSVIPLTLEASVATGDVGGPLLVQTNGVYQLVGVLSGRIAGTNTNASEYGDRGMWASTAQSENFNYLLGQGVVAPEPGTWAFVAAGTVGLGLVLRRRAGRA